MHQIVSNAGTSSCHDVICKITHQQVSPDHSRDNTTCFEPILIHLFILRIQLNTWYTNISVLITSGSYNVNVWQTIFNVLSNYCSYPLQVLACILFELRHRQQNTNMIFLFICFSRTTDHCWNANCAKPTHSDWIITKRQRNTRMP